MIFPDVVEKQLCVAFPFLGRTSVTACYTNETGSSPARPSDVKQDTVTTQVNWKSALLTHCQRKWAPSSTAQSCAEPSNPPLAAKTQHMCKVINSYHLTPETKWTGAELENISAKKQWTGSHEGQNAVFPCSLCTQVCIHIWPRGRKCKSLLPS